MGLRVSHGCWYGSYTAFKRWRDAISFAAGVQPVWDRFDLRNYDGIWSTPPFDPLFVLLVHSDCGGVISAEHAGPLADRLESLLPSIADVANDAQITSQGGRIQVTRNFIQGLRAASKAGESIVFS